MNDTIVLVLCLGLAGVISGLTGFAFALVAAGTVLSIRPPVEAAALVLICSVISQALSVWRLKTLPPRQTVIAMIAAGLPGAPIGVILLHDLDPHSVKITIGLFLVAYSAVVALLRPGYQVRFGNIWSDGVVGFLGGVLGGIAGLSGALPTAWSLVRGWDPRTARAIYQTYTLVLQIWALMILAVYDPIPDGLLPDLAVAIPVVLASVPVGLALFARIDQRRFRAIVLVLLAAIGLTTAGTALIGS